MLDNSQLTKNHTSICKKARTASKRYSKCGFLSYAQEAALLFASLMRSLR
jgi:hypothetical protein